MRKIILASLMVLALNVGLAVSLSVACMMKTEGHHAMEAVDFIGKSVMNSERENLGMINDIVKDPDGRISFAILSFGNYEDYGDSARQVAVPFSALSFTGQDYILHSSYEQLALSPVFLSKDELVDWKTAENLYKHFGLQPYWTEEETLQQENSNDITIYDYY